VKVEKDKEARRLCWDDSVDEKVGARRGLGTEEVFYASRCAVILVRMILLFVGLDLTPGWPRS
jgi:hypothetical protein